MKKYIEIQEIIDLIAKIKSQNINFGLYLEKNVYFDSKFETVVFKPTAKFQKRSVQRINK